ncbi:MAG: acetylxylan esterase [Candidatus Omnitrophica bacterium]|nr:acetylxylan esterase [Candidatus Omnitrophota bacterium]
MKQLRLGLEILMVAAVAVTATPSEADSNRTLRYTSRSAEAAREWQNDLRGKFATLLKIEDLLTSRVNLPNATTTLSEEDRGSYLRREIEFASTPGRRIRAILTLPKDTPAPSPAVVCIHGHGHDRTAVHDPALIYRGFATRLAERGAVTIAVDVGQHQVYEEGRTLMGERLWDLIRCVDLVSSLRSVDRQRLGCAGLSLGGEMAMWLGAMDTRVSAVLSSGFLTTMDQMEKGHCMCWKFEGLRELADWADVYSLIAPRALLCQNGLKEPPTDFTVPLAEKALAEVRLIYTDLGAEDKVGLVAHPEGHVVNLPTLLDFFDKTLGIRER